MEKKSFKKLFLGQIFIASLLILGSTAFNMNFNSDEEYENIKILMTAKSGLQFSKEDSPRGRKIIYDCELGLHTSGHIDIFDEIHPKDMRSLIIKNCFDLTIDASHNYYNDPNDELEELKISNVTFLKLVNRCRNCYYLNAPDFKVSIMNVQIMDIDDVFYNVIQRLSLNLENVEIDSISNLFSHEAPTKVFSLHLKNVKVNETKPGAFYSKKDSKFILTIEDSDFENVHRNAFDFDGEVKITNNRFGFLDENAFSINTQSPFIFSGNHVKRMLNPFNIAAYDVNIINNTFDSITTQWLKNIVAPSNTSFRVLNITENIINHWSHNLFYLDPQNLPDLIHFDRNYLNCSCRNALAVSNKFQNCITQVFLNKRLNNFCHNFENCPLQKTLEQSFKVCTGTFQCHENQNEDDEDLLNGKVSHLKSILFVLKNIDTKVDQIVSKYNSLLPDKPN